VLIRFTVLKAKVVVEWRVTPGAALCGKVGWFGESGKMLRFEAEAGAHLVLDTVTQ